MTDSEKVLQQLRLAGPRGCHSFDLIRLCGTTRIAARCHDLKKRGHAITSVPERKGGAIGCRYFLNELVKKEIEFKWIFDGRTARQVPIEREKIVQGNLF